jgi:hypothetical protein
MTTQPKIGQIMTVRGQQVQIVRIHPFGTVDVSNPITGKSFRVTGLPFISENDKVGYSGQKAY